jgi:predicted SAM-dependent methyltransferase
MTEAVPGGRRLHIGGQQRREGWEILDANTRPDVDHVGDAGDLARFPDGTFAAVYASHVLEHFDYKDELAQVLKEWRRVLAPGGTLYVSVPDLERLCHLYLTPRLAPDARVHIMRMMFGGHVDDYDYHMAGIDEAFLMAHLQQAGFQSARRVGSFGLFNDTSAMEFLGMPISLNVTAVR